MLHKRTNESIFLTFPEPRLFCAARYLLPFELKKPLEGTSLLKAGNL